MADGDRLGIAGGPRGVDGVADVVRVHAGSGRRRGPARQVGGELAERDQPSPRAGERVRPGRDHRRRAHLGADLVQALRRERRVERQVTAACLHDREDGADHVDAPLQVDADHRFRADADFAEVVREPIGRGVQLAIGHPCSAGDHGPRVGTPDGLLREELVNEWAAVRAAGRGARADAGGGHVRPGAGDGCQALASGHDGGATPPAGRHVEPCLPERVLVLVVDDDKEGFRRRLSRLVHGSH